MNALARELRLNMYTLKKIFNGQIHTTRDKALYRTIREYLSGDHSDRSLPQPAQESESQRKIPLYGEIPAGVPNFHEGFTEPDEWIEPAPGLPNRQVFALRVQGLSMSPHLLPGDIVYLEPLDLHLGPKDPQRPAPRLLFERLNGRIVAAMIDGESTIKVLSVTADGPGDYDLHLVPLNTTFPPIHIKPENDVRFQGVVLKAVRDELLPHVLPKNANDRHL